MLADHPRIDLVGVCDLSPAAAAWTADRYRTRPFTEHRTMLAVTSPDVVHVVTPPRSHRAIAEDALRAGAHVIVEKPIAASKVELEAMFALADECGRLLVENHNNLFNDQVLAIDDLHRRGALGEVVGVDVLLALDVTTGKLAMADGNPTAHLPGGAVRDFLTHLAYLGLHFFGDAIVGDVDARWANRSGTAYVGADDLAARVEVGAGVMRLRFDARIAPECFRIWVRGTQGSVETDLYQPFLRVETRRGPKQLSPVINHAVNGGALAAASVRNLRNKVLQHTTYHGLWRFLERFYESVLDGTPPPVTRADVLRTNDLVDRIVQTASAR